MTMTMPLLIGVLFVILPAFAFFEKREVSDMQRCYGAEKRARLMRRLRPR